MKEKLRSKNFLCRDWELNFRKSVSSPDTICVMINTGSQFREIVELIYVSERTKMKIVSRDGLERSSANMSAK